MQLYLLPSNQYSLIYNLFGNALQPTLYDQGVVTGKYPGKILVDDITSPRSAVIIKDIWCHLVGDPENVTFNLGLQKALSEKQFVGEKTNVLFFMRPSEAWLKVLMGLVENRQPIETPRYIYTANQGLNLEVLPPPADFKLVFINETMRELVDGELPDDVQKVLELRNGSSAPDTKGFGYAALHERTCAAWSVIDFMVDKKGEIRLVTDGRFRRRGLAYLASAMTIQYGLANGLNEIIWDVAASNIGSIRTAEKLGLALHSETREFTLIFPEIGYLINLAWGYLDRNQFEQVLVVADRMVISEEEILVQYGHFLTAAAWAGLGNNDKAFHHLNKSIDNGFDDMPELEGCPPLVRLQRMPEWQLIIERLKANP